MDPSQAVRDEIADLSRGDLEAVLSYYTDDVYFEDTSVPTPCRTKAEMRDFMQVFYDAFPDLRIEIRNVFEGGRHVTAEYHTLGTMRGEFLGHSPTGKAFRIRPCRFTSTTAPSSPKRRSTTTPPHSCRRSGFGRAHLAHTEGDLQLPAFPLE